MIGFRVVATVEVDLSNYPNAYRKEKNVYGGEYWAFHFDFCFSFYFASMKVSK